MSSISDLLGFELFNLKDIFKGIKKDPERLFLGAADPFSSKMWGGITGKDYEPLIDQMGGPYGGHTISAFGNNEGGVYGRAEQAGIDTGAGKGMNDLAHVIAAIFAGNYGMKQLPQGMGQQSQFGQMGQMPQMPQQPQQPAPQQIQLFAEMRRRAEERRKEDEMRRQLAAMLGRQ